MKSRITQKISSNWNLYKTEVKKDGAAEFFKTRFKKVRTILDYEIKQTTRKDKTFVFSGRTYKYLLAKYNQAWMNERAVEIPIAKGFLDSHKNKSILEIGNVLSHYYHVNHDIVDKYEIAKKVINEDVVDFSPNKRYDLILAISTLEHVGWEENPQEPKKIIDAINHLKMLLKKNGKIIITLPIGYHNPFLNNAIKNNQLMLSEKYYMRRVSKSNDWEETTWDSVKNIRYNKPFNNSNAILIGIISN